MNSPFYQYKDFMTERYGHPLFRVPIDFGTGCPNRAPDGSGGCTFCPEHGSRARQTRGVETVHEQMIEAIRFARNRYGAKKFMAYMQAFSATFEPPQQKKFLDLLNDFDFTAVSIGTRPDCLTEEAYAFLKNLSGNIETWVELGVQTVHNRTLKRINRGHGWEESRTAILKLHECGIQTAVHVIIGLPGETAEDFQQTADTLAALPVDAIKIHNLHVIKNTALAREFTKRPFQTMDEYDYAEILIDFIRRLPPQIPIIRISTDTPPDELIAPKWHMAKGQFRDYVIKQMIYREWRQGDLWNGSLNDANPELRKIKIQNSARSDLPLPVRSVTTGDSSITFWNEEYKEHYHTPAGARLEAMKKYIVPGNLRERLKKGDVSLLDVCFGLGYNSLCALNVALETAPPPSSEDTGFATPYKLEITALEMDRRVVRAAAESIQTLKTDPFDWKKTLT